MLHEICERGEQWAITFFMQKMMADNFLGGYINYGLHIRYILNDPMKYRRGLGEDGQGGKAKRCLIYECISVNTNSLYTA